MKRRLQFTEQVARFVDHYMPATDRDVFTGMVDRILEDPECAGTHLVYTDDPVTRGMWEGHVNLEYVVTWHFVVVIEVDIYDAARGFNEF
ncbi:hypothetical protein ACIBEA_26945 [Streptomyces sp. NPDC051555]|uniref:hypothetical protein n=1 Tax=Streptomyces sp. NPDC051555 TaxID=3365657 RepID=UPI00379DB940